MINQEMLTKYNMPSLAEYIDGCGEGEITGSIEFYQCFLSKTDYITNKIVESESPQTVRTQYADVIEARAYARTQINELQI